MTYSRVKIKLFLHRKEGVCVGVEAGAESVRVRKRRGSSGCGSGRGSGGGSGRGSVRCVRCEEEGQKVR